MRFVIRTLITALALWVATVLPGISVSGGNAGEDALTLIAVAIIFGLVNAILKPLVMIFGCVFYIVTLGLIAFVVNALLFLFVDWIAQELGLPFHVAGFWSAFWGAIIVSLVSWAVNLAIPDRTPTPQ